MKKFLVIRKCVSTMAPANAHTVMSFDTLDAAKEAAQAEVREGRDDVTIAAVVGRAVRSVSLVLE